MSVYRVTEIIGTSPTGWEDAAKVALAAAAGSLRDLRVAEVFAQDITLDGKGGIELSRGFKYEQD
jgi:dodecin